MPSRVRATLAAPFVAYLLVASVLLFPAAGHWPGDAAADPAPWEDVDPTPSTADGSTAGVPPAPTHVNANLAAGTADVRVTWTPSSPEVEVDHYEVWRSTSYDPARAGYAVRSPDLPPGTTSWTDAGAGLDPVPYFYFVRAANASGSSNSASQAAKFSRTIGTAEPHLLSTPVFTTSVPAFSFQGSFAWSVLRAFDPRSPDPWKSHDAAKGWNDLTAVGPIHGVWVGAASPGDYRVAGSVPCTYGIPLVAGWNLVGFPSMAAYTVATATASLTGPVVVEGYDGTGPYHLRRLAGSDAMEPTLGYWILSPVPQLWTIVNDPAPGCEEVASASDFVVTQGAGLARGGDPFRVLGGNSYAILSEYLGIGRIDDSNPRPMRRLADAAAANLGAIRFWLDVAPSDYWFGRTYGIFETDPARYLAALRQLRDDAAAYGIYLIPVFISGYTQFSDRGGSSIWQLGGPADVLFKDWMRTIVKAFRDDPQILMWEVANEPNYYGLQGPYATDIPTIIAWMRDKVDFVRALDPNHIVSGGYNNTSNFDEQDFKELNAFCDVAVVHIYDVDLYALMAGQGITDPVAAIDFYVASYVQWSKADLGKPLLFGEFNGDLFADPANPYAGWLMEALHRRGVDAGLIWSWEEGLDQYRILPGAHPEIVAALTTWGAQFNTWRGGN